MYFALRAIGFTVARWREFGFAAGPSDIYSPGRKVVRKYFFKIIRA